MRAVIIASDWAEPRLGPRPLKHLIDLGLRVREKIVFAEDDASTVAVWCSSSTAA
jgi:hypothetical protein